MRGVHFTKTMSTQHNPNDEQLTNLTRRQALKAGALATGAATVGVGADQAGFSLVDSVRASTSSTPFWPDAPSQTAFLAPTSVIGAFTTDPDITVGDISFHQSAVQSYSSWTNVEDWANNAYETSRIIAFEKARHIIATSWEDEETADQAQDNAHQAIEEYIDIPWQNTFAAKMHNLVTLAAIYSGSQETDEVEDGWDDGFLTPTGTYTGGDFLADESHILQDVVEIDIEMPSGKSRSFQVPTLVLEFDDGNTWSSTINESVLDAYDPAEEMFTDLTIDGESFDVRFQFITPHLENLTDSNYDVSIVGQLGDLAQALNDIEAAGQEIKDNITQGFVDDLYTALDNGDITPSQVRGPSAMSTWLSGDTDATTSRWQISLSTNLDLPRPNLDSASLIEIEFDGFTDEVVRFDDETGDQYRELADHTEEPVHYEGMLFADEISTNLETGGTYIVDGDKYEKYSEESEVDGDNYVYLTETDNFDVLDLETQDVNHSFDGSGWQDVCLSPDFETVVVVDHDSKEIIAYDTETREQKYAITEPIVDTAIESISADLNSLYLGNWDGEIFSYNLDDGTQNWTVDMFEQYNLVEDGDIGYADTMNPDSDRLYIGSNDGYLLGVDKTSGDLIWHYDDYGGSRINDLSVGYDKNHIYTASADNTFRQHNSSDGTENWREEQGEEQYAIQTSPNGDSLFVASSNNVEAWDIDSRERIATSDAHAESISYITVTSDSQTILAADNDGMLVAYDSDLGEKWEAGNYTNTIQRAETRGERHWFDPQDWILESDEDTEYLDLEEINPDGYIKNGMFTGTRPEMDEFEEMYMAGVMKITHMQDPDGETVDEINTDTDDPDSDWGGPEWDTTEIDEYVDYITETMEDLGNAIEDAGTDDTTTTGGILDSGDWWPFPTLPGVGAVGTAVAVVLALFGLGQLTN